MSNFRYFTDEETKGTDPEFVSKMDKGRHESGIPWIVTSWARSQTQNDAQKDSVKDSAHLIGRAADVLCTDGHQLQRMLYGASLAFINRIGIYIKKVDGKWVPTHLHFDDDPLKTQEIVWITEEL